EINKYLDIIRIDPDIYETWNRTVLRCGAYVGEVIRANRKISKFHWIDYKNALKVNPKSFETYGQVIATAMVLYSEEPFFCFPLGKVEKYLLNGPEDNVQLFAKVIISQVVEV